jgi:hypothetical protein
MLSLEPGLQASGYYWRDGRMFRVLRGDRAVIRRILLLRDHETFKSFLSLSALSVFLKLVVMEIGAGREYCSVRWCGLN